MDKIKNLYQRTIDCIEESITQQPDDSIYQALKYWKFVQSEVEVQNWEMRRELLGMFMFNGNHYIPIISMIESLPVSIWRRILWRYNINYESHRSFLRRILPEEEEAIMHNYLDLIIDKKQPRILTFFERQQKRFEVKSLLAEEDDHLLRNKGKGSWSYNLISLDLGFNAYRNGLDDDIQTQAKTWRDFLSIKNHANDFVVNQESGKYWWLYRTARSNYGWMRNRTVELKSHICPGFWWTIAVHLVFWILSPVAAICGGLSYNSVTTWADLQWAGPLFVLGLITPLWIISAILWSLIRWILPPNKRTILWSYIEKFNRKMNLFYTIIGIVFAVIFCLCFCAGVSLILFDFLRHGFGIIGAIAIIAVTYLYIGNLIVYDISDNVLPNISDHHFVFRFIYFVFVARIVAEFFLRYGHIFSEAIAIFGAIFWKALLMFGIPGLFIIGLMALPILLFAISSFITNEKVLNQIIDFTFVAGIVIVISGYAFILYNIILIIETQSVFQVLIVALAWTACLCFSCLMICLTLNYDLEARRYGRWFSAKNDATMASLPIGRYALKRLLKKNLYYKRLSRDKQAELLYRARVVMYFIFDFRSEVAIACKILLPVMTKKIISVFEEIKKETSKIPTIGGQDELFLLFRLIANGMESEKAFEQVKKSFAIKRKRKKWILNAVISVADIILKPFIVIWNGLKKVWQLIKQVKWVYDKFNQMCPFVKTSGQLTLN